MHVGREREREARFLLFGVLKDVESTCQGAEYSVQGQAIESLDQLAVFGSLWV